MYFAPQPLMQPIGFLTGSEGNIFLKKNSKPAVFLRIWLMECCWKDSGENKDVTINRKTNWLTTIPSHLPLGNSHPCFGQYAIQDLDSQGSPKVEQYQLQFLQIRQSAIDESKITPHAARRQVTKGQRNPARNLFLDPGVGCFVVSERWQGEGGRGGPYTIQIIEHPRLDKEDNSTEVDKCLLTPSGSFVPNERGELRADRWASHLNGQPQPWLQCSQTLSHLLVTQSSCIEQVFNWTQLLPDNSSYGGRASPCQIPSQTRLLCSTQCVLQAQRTDSSLHCAGGSHAS